MFLVSLFWQQAVGTLRETCFPGVQPIARRIQGGNALVIRKRGSGADDPSRTVLKKLRDDNERRLRAR